jgi:NAD-dependent dihydropyrimidine dehydrogenase PreA subunit
VSIAERGCRGCTLCVDICPVDVFDCDEERHQAVVRRQEDCIGCLSCHYICPSQCVEVGEVESLRPYHRIEGHVALIERFLQQPAASRLLSEEDLAEGYRDVAARLAALARAVVEILGRGHKAVGRRAGAVAASHLPEVYEEPGIEGILTGMQRLFRHAFDFDYRIEGDRLALTFSPCGLCRLVEDAGEKVGEAVLCEIFHEYWAGLLTAYVGTTFRYEMPTVGSTCEMRLFPAR